MSVTTPNKQRWVVNNVDELTIAVVKTLATSKGYSMGFVLDLAVEYFGRKVRFENGKPLTWSLPDDFG